MNFVSSPIPVGIIIARSSFTPKNLGIDGPVISASRTPTLKPFLASSIAIIPVTVDFPTPPFPLITPIIFDTLPYLGVCFPPQFWLFDESFDPQLCLLGHVEQFPIFIRLLKH